MSSKGETKPVLQGIQSEVMLGDPNGIMMPRQGRRSFIVIAVCVIVFCIIVTVGLWPFEAPLNQVSQLTGGRGLHFGPHGSVLSSGGLRVHETSCSIEVLLQPEKIDGGGEFLAFYSAEPYQELSLGQYRSGVVLQKGFRSGDGQLSTATSYLANILKVDSASLVTLTSNGRRTGAYVNGRPVNLNREFLLPCQYLAGRISVGVPATSGDSWSGDIFEFAVYGVELSVTQVFERYRSWMQPGQSVPPPETKPYAVFPFGGSNDRVSNRVPGAPFLYIPHRFTVLKGTAFNTPSTEFRPYARAYWYDVAINILGFIPFGWCFFVYLSIGNRTAKAASLTILLGFSVSFAIEWLQQFLPTRVSSCTDVVANTLGACVGVVLSTSRPRILGRL